MVGNDGSTDQTLEILQSLSHQNSNVRIFDIKDMIIKKPGKQNVLAQIAPTAKGSVLLFTDADTELPPSWIMTMVRTMRNDFGDRLSRDGAGEPITVHSPMQ